MAPIWCGVHLLLGRCHDLVPGLVEPRPQLPCGDGRRIPVAGEKAGPHRVQEPPGIAAVVRMRQDPGYRVLEQVQPAAGPLGGHQAPHDHAPQLGGVGHRAALRVAVHLDGVIDRPVVERAVGFPSVVHEEPDSDVQ